MKKRFLTIFSIVFVMAFAVAVYAFNQSNTTSANAAVSCAMKDNCPLKGENAQTAGVKTDGSCCDMPDCCCKNGSCPMKKSGEKSSSDCCDNCCGGSCSMKEKQSATTAVQTEKESSLHKTAGV